MPLYLRLLFINPRPIYCMSRKSFPFLHRKSIYKDKQDILDEHYTGHFQRFSLMVVVSWPPYKRPFFTNPPPIYCMSRKSCPFLHRKSIYKDDQDILDKHYTGHFQRFSLGGGRFASMQTPDIY